MGSSTVQAILVFLALASALSFASHAARAGEPVSVAFEDLPALLEKGNQEIFGARRSTDAAEARTGHLGRSFLPSLAFEGGVETYRFIPYNLMTDPVASVESNVNLFRSGRDRLEEDAREAERNVAWAQLDQVRWRELTEARKIYWDLVFGRQLLQVLEESLSLNQRNSAAAKRRIDAGLATETDRLEFEISRVQLEQELAAVRLELESLERALVAKLGFPEGASVTVAAELPAAVVPKKEGAGEVENRELRALRFESLANEARARQARRWWAPSVDAFGNYGLLTFRDRELTSWQDRLEPTLGIRVRLELFDGLESASSARSLSAQAEAATFAREQRSRDIAASRQNLASRLELGASLVRSAEKNLEAGQNYLKKTLEEYARGVKNSPDVLGATERYVELKRRLLELKRDFHQTGAELRSLLEK